MMDQLEYYAAQAQKFKVDGVSTRAIAKLLYAEREARHTKQPDHLHLL